MTVFVPNDQSTSAKSLLEYIDFLRIDASRKLGGDHRSAMGQFFTPPSVARMMSSMLVGRPEILNILDAGAGVGSLSAACVEDACRRKQKPKTVTVTAYEVEPLLIEYLRQALDKCVGMCRQAEIKFDYEIVQNDFVAASVAVLRDGWLGQPHRFNVAILNPPYRKINTDSKTRSQLRTVGIETSNLYTAFVWLAIKLLEPKGEIVAIVPRSFCNGPYFRPFRLAFLKLMSIRRVHIYDSRDRAFKEEDVLQENIILHATKTSDRTEKVLISSSAGPDDEDITIREVEYRQVVHPTDQEAFVHIVPDELGEQIKQQMDRLNFTLEKLGIGVSTGRVVDFRAKKMLRKRPGKETVPLIYPTHFLRGYVSWPGRNSKKSNAIVANSKTAGLLVPAGFYVLVKRFSSKEERRRVVAAVYSPNRISASRVGFENHVNYYHKEHQGLSPDLAKGLAAFLNTTLVDEYFRQFNGHTQVNANDLRRIRYPSLGTLRAFGSKIGIVFPDQEKLDRLAVNALKLMSTDERKFEQDPVQAKQKINDALALLQELGLPRAQRNERSALTLLALLDLKPNDPWSKATPPMRGITEMMDYFRDYFGRKYMPNTRESVRRQTVAQFQQAGLVTINPDDPNRPINSPNTRYQIDMTVLRLIQMYGSVEWDKHLKSFLDSTDQLSKLRAEERKMALMPVRLPDGKEIDLTAGGQNVLIKKIIEQFCPRFTPEGTLAFVSDAGNKAVVKESAYLKKLGIEIDKHGKMPDVIVHFGRRNWLILVEAVTSHGPIDIKRHNELTKLFEGSTAGLVFVTAFETRRAMTRFLSEISWETDVWVAESPSHLVHFNGEKFLGPYE